MNSQNIKKDIIEYAKNLGANLVGFAPVSRWEEFNEVKEAYRPEVIWPQAQTVIVLGIPVLLPILETTPSINYVEQYDTANIMLDQIAYRLSIYLNELGHASIFLPRDGYGDIKVLVEKPVAAFGHVYAAKYAGLGTVGYNNTLLNEKFGPRVRYVSVFTALAIPGDPLIEKDLCNKCRVCQKLCPSQAFLTRDNDLVAQMDKVACAKYHDQLREEHRYPCGICIKVCHVGQDRNLYKSTDIKLYLDEKKALEEDPADPRYQGWVHCRTHGSKGDRIS
ncbi:epoxyqueuosine reductase [Pelosinus propionicus]|uniref:Epoxyqueuosine reductase QueG (Queuosine biosynthesis) n=1 Tax=Pelosinus propionicus DSM 13327 TaxID=1123291 RepID=A0A1I4NE52_9FIRM|nr:epoxyqueuosine reductase [Pelosinus propionicus]SFM13665.1 Epoxyqueuosine reductase QueG (queuosine biosynthesis) [Pelosinus propionicus DSM 13327]